MKATKAKLLHLEPEQQAELLQMLREHRVPNKERVNIILVAHAGKTRNDIANELKISVGKVDRWLKRWRLGEKKGKPLAWRFLDDKAIIKPKPQRQVTEDRHDGDGTGWVIGGCIAAFLIFISLVGSQTPNQDEPKQPPHKAVSHSTTHHKKHP